MAHHREEFVAPGPDALLFPAADGVSSLQPSGFYKYWKEARAAAGRPDLAQAGGSQPENLATALALAGSLVHEALGD